MGKRGWSWKVKRRRGGSGKASEGKRGGGGSGKASEGKGGGGGGGERGLIPCCCYCRW
jgi:hypothetical protein